MRGPETRGERIRRYRIAARLSLDQCAKRAGMSKALLSHWEHDKIRNPGGEKLGNLARVLGKSPEILLHGDRSGLPDAHKSAAEEDEMRLVRNFRHVPEPVREHLARIVEALAKN